MSSGTPIKKIDQLRGLMAAGEWQKAILLAAKWHDLGQEKGRILGAREGLLREDFQRQLGKDPQALISDGVAGLKARYGDPDSPDFNKAKA